jgi:hypothetical protein
MHIIFDVPALDKYPSGFLGFWGSVLFVGHLSSSFQVNTLATTYVRLVEASFIEYRFGRETLFEFWNTHDSIRLSAFNRSIAHFECCLSDMYRAVKCFTRLRRHPDLPVSLKKALNEHRPLFVADVVADRLGKVRNEVHHLEELVMDGRLEMGQPSALSADGPETPHPTEPNQTNKTIDRLKIASREISFRELVMWLHEMGDFAARIESAARPASRGSATET